MNDLNINFDNIKNAFLDEGTGAFFLEFNDGTCEFIAKFESISFGKLFEITVHLELITHRRRKLGSIY